MGIGYIFVSWPTNKMNETNSVVLRDVLVGNVVTFAKNKPL